MVAQPIPSVAPRDSYVNIWNPIPNRRVIESARCASPQAIAESRAFAERLLKDERVIASGPVESGGRIYIPSPCWRPEAVAEWKRAGGRPKKLKRLFDVWIVDARRMSLVEAQEIYSRYFFREIAISKNNLRLRQAGV